jgi:hypothetical protein
LTFSEIEFLCKKNDRPSGAKASKFDEAQISHEATKLKRCRENGFLPSEKAEEASAKIRVESTTTISKPENQSRPFSQSISYYSRRSTTFNPDDHSEYSLRGMQTRLSQGHGLSNSNSTKGASIPTVDFQEKSPQQEEQHHNSPGPDPQEESKPAFVTKTLLQEEPSKARRVRSTAPYGCLKMVLILRLADFHPSR